MLRLPRCVLFVSLLAAGHGQLFAQPPDAEFSAASVASLGPDAWQRLTTGSDLKAFAARTRALGWPDFVVRWIVYEQVREQEFATRMQEVVGAIESQYYWRAPFMPEPKLEQLRRGLNRDINEMSHQLLGPAADALTAGERAVYRRQFGDLPDAKIDALQRVRDDYRDLIKIARAESSILARPNPPGREAVALLERDQLADMKKLLTAEERELFERQMNRMKQFREGGATAVGPRPASDPAWLELQRDDLAALESRLRAAGFPGSSIRAVLTLEVYSRVMQRELREIYDPGEGGTRLDTPEKQAASERIKRDQNALLTQVGGADPRLSNPIALAYQRRIFGSLSAEKISRILAAYEDRAAQDEVLRQVLTPAERESWEASVGPWAQYLQNAVIGFSATRVEFEAVTRIYRPIVEKFAPDGSLSAQQAEAFEEAEKASEPALRETLGDERFADFVQAKRGERPLNEVVLYLDLPISAARKVVAIRTDVEARAKKEGSPALKAEAERRVAEVLGTRGLELYRDHGGQWISGLGSRL